MRKKKIIHKALFILLDSVLLFLSILSSYYIYVYFDIGLGQRFGYGDFVLYALLVSLCSVIVLEFMGLYNVSGSFLYVKEVKIIIKGLLLCFVLVNLIIVLRAGTMPLVSRFVMAGALVIAVAVLTFARFINLFLASRFFKGYINVIVVGYNDKAQKFINTLLRHRIYGYRLLGVADDTIRSDIRGSDGIDSGIGVRHLSSIKGIEGLELEDVDIFFVFPVLDGEQKIYLDKIAEKYGIETYWFPENGLNLFYNADFFYMGNRPFIKKAEHRTAFYYRFAKRAMDILISVLMAVILLPFILLVSVIIKASSKGPVIFRQERIGKDGKPFVIHKFRTMRPESPGYEKSPETPEDARLTGIGRYLRKFSLDELPQLANVFMGSMSLVGPRPEMPFIVNKYNEFERMRLKVKPGLTGIWQISAERQKPIHYSIEYDIFYVYNRSISLDFAIMLETALFMLNPKGI